MEGISFSSRDVGLLYEGCTVRTVHLGRSRCGAAWLLLHKRLTPGSEIRGVVNKQQ